MSLKIRQSSRFKRDIKRIRKRHLDMAKLEPVIRTLVDEHALEAKYRDHILSYQVTGKIPGMPYPTRLVIDLSSK